MKNETPKGKWDWREDLEASRDLSGQQKRGFGYFVNWFESWRLQFRRPADLETARAFWKEVVMGKAREPWQLEQWAEAMRWYLHWLELARRTGADHRSLAERVRDAVESAGARRGLAIPTRRAYGSWAARFAATVGTPEEAMNEDLMSDWLGRLVSAYKMPGKKWQGELGGLKNQWVLAYRGRSGWGGFGPFGNAYEGGSWLDLPAQAQGFHRSEGVWGRVISGLHQASAISE